MFLKEEEKIKLKDFLKNIDFMKGLPDHEIAMMIESLDRKQVQKGQTIVFQGEISHMLYMIFAGRVSVNIKHAGEKKVVAELHAGDYFGEISLLEPATASATLKAEEACDLFILLREDFMRIAETVPGSIETVREKILARKASMSKSKEVHPE